MRVTTHDTWRATRRWLATAGVLVVLAIAGLPASAVAEAADAKAVAAADTAERFVAAINAADGSALNELIDVDALGERVLRNLDLNAVDRVRYLAGLRAQHAMLGYSVAAQLGQQRAKAVLLPRAPSGAGAGFMARVTTRDAKGNQGHGYLQVEVGPDGRIVDWYDHAMALSMSGQLAFSAAGLLTTEQIARLFLGAGADAVGTAVLMQRLSAALSTGDMHRAHAVLLELPESVKARREFATLLIAAARSVGMDAYREALAELARRHGDADDLQLILIDHYLLNGKQELALKAIDRAARVIGDDEVMDANRCVAFMQLERKAEALKACDRSIARNPEFETPRWTRVILGVKTKDASLAMESLTGVEQAQGKRLDPAQLGKMDFYAWLVKQPEWAAWASERGWMAPAQ